MSERQASYSAEHSGHAYPNAAVGHGQTCPACGVWHNGVHVCGGPRAPFVAHATAAEAQSLREQVERLERRVGELEKGR